ncbi:MAG: hypothetical protein F7C34_01160 [Desulfurococcales archaeon]|nr:hypothetical protein [Desulfurococcales archaeon]
MTDYRLAIYYGKKLLNETSGDVLMPGSKANVSINLDDVPDVEKIEIVFQGKIDGLYYVSLRLHR